MHPKIERPLAGLSILPIGIRTYGRMGCCETIHLASNCPDPAVALMVLTDVEDLGRLRPNRQVLRLAGLDHSTYRDDKPSPATPAARRRRRMAHMR